MPSNNIPDQNSYSVRIYGESGASKDLLQKINDSKIQTLDDILHFRKSYAIVRQKTVNDSIEKVKSQIQEITLERNQLIFERDQAHKSKSEELDQTISRLEREQSTSHQQHNFFVGFYYKIKRWARNKKIRHLKNNFRTILCDVTKNYDKQITAIENKIKYTEANVQSVAENNISSELHRFDDLKNKIEKEAHLIYGAIGETNVITELKKLPPTYHVINDFRDEYHPPIYNRTENDRIYSIQVDHLIVGPTGIFVIETKYWSDKSISNDMLFSPVKQVKRAGFALFVLLNDAIKSRYIMKLLHNWGERKISPKQIVVFLNNVPQAEFQYVKFLGIERLNSYITYGKQVFTTEEVQDIVDYLLHQK